MKKSDAGKGPRVPVIEIIFPQASATVPAFLTKLWKMVDDSSTDSLISWSDEGNSFIIHDQVAFTQGLLPHYYKHSNMASFIRQLNMYGFHKVMSIEYGSFKNDRAEEMEFAHMCFLKGHEEMLEQIRRKTASKPIPSPPAPMPTNRQDKVNEVLGELNFLKDKQEDMDSKLETMKKENEALWREVVNLRQKHSGQQKIVNKLIQFLMSVVHPRMSSIVKRRYQHQLAIEDAIAPTSSTASSKVARLSNEKIAGFNANHGFKAKIDSQPEDLTNSMNSLNFDLFSKSELRPVDPTMVSSTVRIPSSVKKEPSLLVNGEKLRASVTLDGISNVQREMSRENFDFETSLTQKDLESLKDVLSGQITLDTSLLNNIFSADELLGSCFGLGNDSLSGNFPGSGKLSLELDPNLSQTYNENIISDDSLEFNVNEDEQLDKDEDSIIVDYSDHLSTTNSIFD